MAKRRLPNRESARALRTGILDGRYDAALWGHPQENGVDTPRWRKSFWWKGIGGEPNWFVELYNLAYGKTYSRQVTTLWKGKSRDEIDAAKATVARNRLIRNETGQEREIRLLREKVAELTASRHPELS